jgi:hypothetical protein
LINANGLSVLDTAVKDNKDNKILYLIADIMLDIGIAELNDDKRYSNYIGFFDSQGPKIKSLIAANLNEDNADQTKAKDLDRKLQQFYYNQKRQEQKQEQEKAQYSNLAICTLLEHYSQLLF